MSHYRTEILAHSDHPSHRAMSCQLGTGPRLSEAERIAAKLLEERALGPRRPRPAPTIRRFSWEDGDAES
jgi:hypothetical protein